MKRTTRRRAGGSTLVGFLDFLTLEPSCGCGLVIFLVIGSIALVTYLHQNTETDKVRPIVSEVYPSLEVCDAANESPITVRGKALIWDRNSDSLSQAHFRLPPEIKASDTDNPITVFVITDIRRQQVGSYTLAKAYRQHAKICVVLWPQKEVVGVKTITSLEPPKKRQLQITSEYGDLDIPIADWVEGLWASQYGTPPPEISPTRSAVEEPLEDAPYAEPQEEPAVEDAGSPTRSVVEEKPAPAEPTVVP